MYYFVASKDDCGWFCCSNAATVVESAELSAGSFTVGLTSRGETCCVFSLHVVILRFQIVIAKWYGPESWAGGGFYTIGLNRGGRLNELIAVGGYKVTSNMMVAHLTNADQGEMSWSSPWDLGPGCGHL